MKPVLDEPRLAMGERAGAALGGQHRSLVEQRPRSQRRGRGRVREYQRLRPDYRQLGLDQRRAAAKMEA